eukprot:SAG31_NODE_2167_length_6269_cov_4.097731_1_plen_85_part_00
MPATSIFQDADKNGSGTIDLPELMAHAARKDAAIQLLPLLVDPAAMLSMVTAAGGETELGKLLTMSPLSFANTSRVRHCIYLKD